LTLDDRVEDFEILQVVGENGVERLSRYIDVLGRRGIPGVLERVDLEARGDVLDRRLQAIPDRSAQEEEVPVRRGLQQKITVRHITLVAWRQHKVLAALAPVGAGDADIADKSLPRII